MAHTLFVSIILFLKSLLSTITTETKKHPSTDAASSLWQTPSSIVANTAPPRSAPAESVAVPSARGTYEAKDLEESERERGNAEFKGGNFTAAVKCYTKCLGLKGKNYVAFSNRAMAYLKLKEYARAVVRLCTIWMYYVLVSFDVSNASVHGTSNKVQYLNPDRCLSSFLSFLLLFSRVTAAAPFWLSPRTWSPCFDAVLLTMPWASTVLHWGI